MKKSSPELSTLRYLTSERPSLNRKPIYCEVLYQCGLQPFMFSTQKPAVKCSERTQYCGRDGDKAKAILCINDKVKLEPFRLSVTFV